MLTLSAIADCEGYYLDTETGDILRIVRPQPEQCDQDAMGQGDDTGASLTVPRFERLSGDVTLPLDRIIEEGAARFGRPLSGRIVNRQTARQPDGSLVTEQTEIH